MSTLEDNMARSSDALFMMQLPVTMESSVFVCLLIRRMPEFLQLDNGKSMMRNLPPTNTAGFARRLVSLWRRDPRPPASTSARVSRVSREIYRELLMGIRCSVFADRLKLLTGFSSFPPFYITA